MDAEKVRQAEEIDKRVRGVEADGSGDEELLAGMGDYMEAFKRLLDSCSPCFQNSQASVHLFTPHSCTPVYPLVLYCVHAHRLAKWREMKARFIVG